MHYKNIQFVFLFLVCCESKIISGTIETSQVILYLGLLLRYNINYIILLSSIIFNPTIYMYLLYIFRASTSWTAFVLSHIMEGQRLSLRIDGYATFYSFFAFQEPRTSYFIPLDVSPFIY